MLRRVQAKMGLMSRVREIFSTPLKHLRQWNVPDGEERIISHTTLELGEGTADWQAAITENSFVLAIMQNNEAVSHSNFGTVDNPHVIFSVDTPFRFVGCTGIPSEDDMEGHEIAYFLLREGPLQRCCICGQVFKLVRLRDENTAMNSYYTLGFLRTTWDEIGDSDHAIQQNPIRACLPFTYEHTQFSTNSDIVYSMKNPDDHDHLLVDPAYRLEQLRLLEHKAYVIQKEQETLTKESESISGRPKIAINKSVYENLVLADTALLELEKHFKRLVKFNVREFIDPRNHERRQKRMEKRAEERILDSHTVYLNGFTEGELQYRDYFETDLENDLKLERDPTRSAAQAQIQEEMQLKNLVLTEEYTKKVESDSSSFAERKAFRFVHRAALGELEDHLRREERMLRRAAERRFPELEALAQAQEAIEQTGVTSDISRKAQVAYFQALLNSAQEDYRNYFESDLEEDFEIFEQLSPEEKVEFIASYKNPILEKLISRYPHTHISFPRGKDEHAQGLLMSNAAGFFEELDRTLGPKVSLIDGLSVDPQALAKLDAAERKQIDANKPDRG